SWSGFVGTRRPRRRHARSDIVEGLGQRDPRRGFEPLSYTGLVLVRTLAAVVPLLLTGCVSEGEVLRGRNSDFASTPAAETLLFVDFEGSPVGSYADAAISTDFGDLPWADDGFTEIVEDARGRALRVHYPA